MAKRRTRRRWDDDAPEAEREPLRGRRRRARARRHGGRAAAVAEAEQPAAGRRREAPLTCRDCAHLVITRSLVKHVSQSWDRAVAFRTLTCFQQGWTLEDPDSVADHASVSEYLVSGADRCPAFRRGHPSDHTW